MGLLNRIKQAIKGGKTETPGGNEENVPTEYTDLQCSYCDDYLKQSELREGRYKYLDKAGDEHIFHKRCWRKFKKNPMEAIR